MSVCSLISVRWMCSRYRGLSLTSLNSILNHGLGTANHVFRSWSHKAFRCNGNNNKPSPWSPGILLSVRERFCWYETESEGEVVLSAHAQHVCLQIYKSTIERYSMNTKICCHAVYGTYSVMCVYSKQTDITEDKGNVYVLINLVGDTVADSNLHWLSNSPKCWRWQSSSCLFCLCGMYIHIVFVHSPLYYTACVVLYT